ncbi:30S ribosomal protein S21 [candidate division WWE3 bacterium CG_4_9_14_3_um_filter_34_6]|uniref:Small ribosomal subunit protein bS21 n=1 Tax=candidate division WWE3 bacterium CG_4_9_14_3_um_filter_34_6 TaxID=1975079 RepID=A0A2M7X4A4_UNCKA|nr:MAG: 30S ribosomal protein S21 [candidate division WWE3 bacterium CG_4_9_14_3_um_filter_34_6]
MAKGVTIDLKKSGKSVEQALRDLKEIMESDIEKIKETRYYIKPTKRRREADKVKRANIRKYNKYN